MTNRLRQPCIALTLLSLFLLKPFPALPQTTDSPYPTQGALRSASELDYPPFALVKPDGTADGFSVDLLKAVVKAAGLKIHIAVGPWNEIKQNLIDGRLDVLPLVSYSPERDQFLDFTAPYLRMHGAIFVRKGEKRIRSVADLKDKSVIVMRGDTAHEYVKKKKISDNLVLTDSFEEAFRLLSAGKHDAVVIQQLVGLQLIKQMGIPNVVSVATFDETSLRPSSSPTIGFEQKFCIAVRQGDADLLARLNEGLAIVIADGTYDRLYYKWFSPILPPAPISIKQLARYLVTVLLPIVVLLLGAGLWYLNRKVAEKTASLRVEVQERRQAEQEKEVLITELQKALDEVKTLSGLLPICSTCKKIRDDKGYWNQIENYIGEHSEAQFTHSICPDCLVKHYPDYKPAKQ